MSRLAIVYACGRWAIAEQTTAIANTPSARLSHELRLPGEGPVSDPPEMGPTAASIKMTTWHTDSPAHSRRWMYCWPNQPSRTCRASTTQLATPSSLHKAAVADNQFLRHNNSGHACQLNVAAHTSFFDIHPLWLILPLCFTSSNSSPSATTTECASASGPKAWVEQQTRVERPDDGFHPVQHPFSDLLAVHEVSGNPVGTPCSSPCCYDQYDDKVGPLH